MLPERLQWLTTMQIAALALPGVPETQQGVDALARSAGWADPEQEGVWWRKRDGRGGGVEFRWVLLPEPARLKLAYDYGTVAPESDAEFAKREASWAWFGRLSGKKQEQARERLRMVQACDALQRSGVSRVAAAQQIAKLHQVALSSLYRWREMLVGVEPMDWLPALAPRHAGRPGKAAIPEEAWQAFLADYLRPEKPNLTDCYRRLVELATAHGWTLPSEPTFGRRIAAMPQSTVILAREGRDALQRMYPAQKRERASMRALEAINLDGHKWDVFVRWPDGKVERPQMLVVQDLYSGAILAWRVDRTLHKGLVRLAIGDVVEQWGVAEHCYMDNGRENASKWITGGVPNRYRFKVLDEDPVGLLPLLGIEVHWTTPYSGQSKPIERAFRDFAGGIAKHPKFAGAYVGNKPDAKPDNYGNAAVPLDEFLRVVGKEIEKHNRRPGRLSDVCAGKLSFAEALESSLKLNPVRRATAEQRLLWLLAAQGVRVNRKDGSVEMEGNRYWHDKLHAFRGERLVARFDPDALHADLHLFTLGGSYVVAAPCILPVGFRDADAARAQMRTRRSWMRATREAWDAESRMSVGEVAAMLDKIDDAAPAAPMTRPETTVLRPIFGAGNTALKIEDEEIPEGERLLLQFARNRRSELRAVDGGDD